MMDKKFKIKCYVAYINHNLRSQMNFIVKIM